MIQPARGEVVFIEFDPVRGHEQGGKRPALVVSSDAVNRSTAGLITVVPMTTKARPLRSYVRVDPPEGGLSQVSYAICHQIRTVAVDRILRVTGPLSEGTLSEVEDRLRILLEL
jgi:mRNA interferase MazF